MNLDGLINIQDIILIINMILNNEYYQDGDINNDGSVNVSDIILVVNMILILRKFSIGAKDRYRKATKKQLEQGEGGLAVCDAAVCRAEQRVLCACLRACRMIFRQRRRRL